MERHREAERRQDQRTGLVAASLYNVQRAKRTEYFWTWEDFFPQHRKAPEPQTDEQMRDAMRMWARRRPNPEAN